MPRNLEYKSLNIALKSFDPVKGIFKGYASSFNQIDKVNDTIYPQAFENSITNFNAGTVKIPVNFDHFCEIVLADNLISIIADETGLLVEFQISEEAKKTYSELYAQFIADVASGKLFMSIGGYVIISTLGDDRWLKKEVANANDFISEFELDHIAVTNYPIDSNAKMLEVKSNRNPKKKVQEFSNLNKMIEEIDGELSARKFLETYKSSMSNTAAKNFVLHLKSLWKREKLDNKDGDVSNKNSEPLSIEACVDVKSTAPVHGSKSGLNLSKVHSHLTKK